MIKNRLTGSCDTVQLLSQLAKILYTADPTHDPAYYDTKARIMIEYVTQANLITILHTPVLKDQIEHLESMLKEHIEDHKPLAYCFGNVDFLSLTLSIQPPILIPRPETEAWVAQLIERYIAAYVTPVSILDMGTGSGAIALACAHAFSKSIVVGIDNNPQAIALAKKNKDRYQVHNVSFVESDLFEELSKLDAFSLIVANPPYIDPECQQALDASVKHWEDPYALYAADRGLSLIKKIITQAPYYLSLECYALYKQKQLPNLVIEIGYDQAAYVQKLLDDNGAHNIAVHKDNAAHDRWIEALVVPGPKL